MRYFSPSFFFIILLLPLVITIAIHLEQLYVGVWLCAAAYCPKIDYPHMEVGGPATGFLYNNTLYQRDTDIHGYIGRIPAWRTIYVVIRGAYSFRNSKENIEIQKIPYLTFPECDCGVHRGFYHTALQLRDQVIESVQKLDKDYPRYQVIVTGHSLGAAVAQLLALELLAQNISCEVYNYGQPRVGDANFAALVNQKLNNKLHRVTHYQDWVPHVPMRLLGYVHSCGEIYEDENHNLHKCELGCEDPTCANQFALRETNDADHELYLYHEMSCGSEI
jgi:hypothetical protein